MTEQKTTRKRASSKKAEDSSSTEQVKSTSTTPKKTKQKPKAPVFEAKELLVLDGKDCIFVEKLKGKVVVRFLEGGYASADESAFSKK